MAKKLYEEASVQDIAAAIREKNGTTTKYKVAEMGDAVRAISTSKPEQSKTVTPTAGGLTVTPDSGKTLSSVQINGDSDLVAENVKEGVNIFGVAGTLKSKEEISWHQCPTAVRNYLNQVTYDPSDYSTSRITEFAPATAVASNTKPIGKTVDGVTYYNEIPNVETPFSTETTAGTLKPLDHLRWLNTATMNIRDLGGWACDGGTVKYGMLFRGGEPNAADKALMVEDIGIRHELQLRGAAEAPQQYSLWGVDFTCPETFVWMSLSNKPAWKQILRCVFDTIPFNLPLYFHCAAGADRTATVAVMLEALLGMNQSDIDKDYELTCFSTGTGTDAQARRRDEDEYKAYIAEIKAVQLPAGVDDTFRNHAIYFVASLGFTADEINSFRSAMIDGTPEVISLVLDSFAISKSGSNISFDNEISSVDEYQGYKVNLSAESGYVITDISITMGGKIIDAFKGEKVNLFRRITNSLSNCKTNNENFNCIDGQGYGAIITPYSGYSLDGGTISIKMGGIEVSQKYYSNGTIIIPNVTGDVEISVTAIAQGPAYTNLWQEPYKLNARLNTNETDPAANGMYISAWYSMSGIDTSQDVILRSNKDLWNYSALASSGDRLRGYNTTTAGDSIGNKATDMTSIYFERGFDESSGIYHLIIKSNYWNDEIPNYIRWCAMTSKKPLTSSYFDGCIFTINEEITV